MDARARRNAHTGGVLLARGFTLVELLTVMVIIGLLMGLISVAVIAARSRAKVAATGVEIAALESALHNYRSRFTDFPPDFAYCRGGAPGNIPSMAQGAVVQHLTRMFPRYVLAGSNTSQQWNNLRSAIQRATQPYGYSLDINYLDPATALVFFLGGIPEISNGQTTGKLLGFSANPSNPFDYTSASRIGPFFDFDPTRLEATSARWLRYKPSYGAGPGAPPYIYFRAPYYYMNGTTVVPTKWQRVNTSYGVEQEELGTSQASLMRAMAVRPYYNWSTDDKVRDWYNPKSFQIICAGADNRYGGTSEDANLGIGNQPAVPHFPKSDNVAGGHLDNQTNFCKGVLEDLLK